MSTKLSEKYIYTLMKDPAFVLYILASFLAGVALGLVL